MRFDIRNPSPQTLTDAAAFYGERGYLMLSGLGTRVTPWFDEALAQALGVEPTALGPILESGHAPEHLDSAVLARMSKVTTSAELAHSLLATFKPLLLRTLGAFVQVSSDFHIQFKSGVAGVVDHGGFQPGHREVQGIHLLHQDFTGASIATSPSAITLWVPLNDCDEWTLRLFPRQHTQGLLANEFLQFDDPRLEVLGPPLDITARRGDGVLFNALVLHGSSNPGDSRRVSCDLRFFPLTAFLPSEVHVLGDPAWELHGRGLEQAGSETLLAPFREAEVFLGCEVSDETPTARGALVWVQYLRRLCAGDRDGARESFERFVNAEFGVDDVSAYERLFDGHRHVAQIERVRAGLVSLAH